MKSILLSSSSCFPSDYAHSLNTHDLSIQLLSAQGSPGEEKICREDLHWFTRFLIAKIKVKHNTKASIPYPK